MYLDVMDALFCVYLILTYLITYLLSPRSRVFLEKLTGFQPVKKFPTFYGTECSLPHSQMRIFDTKTINLETDFRFIIAASNFSLLTDINYGNMFRLKFAVISSVLHR